MDIIHFIISEQGEFMHKGGNLLYFISLGFCNGYHIIAKLMLKKIPFVIIFFCLEILSLLFNENNKFQI